MSRTNRLDPRPTRLSGYAALCASVAFLLASACHTPPEGPSTSRGGPVHGSSPRDFEDHYAVRSYRSRYGAGGDGPRGVFPERDGRMPAGGGALSPPAHERVDLGRFDVDADPWQPERPALPGDRAAAAGPPAHAAAGRIDVLADTRQPGGLPLPGDAPRSFETAPVIGPPGASSTAAPPQWRGDGFFDPSATTWDFSMHLGIQHLVAGTAKKNGIDHGGGDNRDSGALNTLHGGGLGFGVNIPFREGMAAGVYSDAGVGWLNAKGGGYWWIAWGGVGGRFSPIYHRNVHFYLLGEMGYMGWDGVATPNRGPRSYASFYLRGGIGAIAYVNNRWGIGAEVYHRFFNGNHGFESHWVGVDVTWRWRW